MVSDERGQLILVGAIVIALVVLGLVLIVNTALFTQIVGSEGTVESAKEGGVAGQEIGNAIAAVVAEENRYNRDISTKNSSIYENVSDRLEQALVNRSIEDSGSFLSVDYFEWKEEGTYVTQATPESFTGSDNETWTPISETNRSDIGDFVMTIDVDDSSGLFNVTVNGSSPRTLQVDVDSNAVGLDGAGATSSCTDIGETGGNVTIDASAGQVYGSSCQFDLFDDTSSSYDIEFTNGDSVNGTYSFATDHDDLSGPSSWTIREAIWSFEYGFTYDSPDATVESESRVIDVYD